MTKYFTSGTSISNLEHLMMEVPNFLERGRGMYVFRNLEHTFKNRVSKHPVLSNLMIREISEGEKLYYQKILWNCFDCIHYSPFKRRLKQLVNWYNGEFFLDDVHKVRFLNACYINNINLKDQSPEFIATLFLLTADNMLWLFAEDVIQNGKIDFSSLHLGPISTRAYAIYKAAKTIYVGKEFIKLNEISKLLKKQPIFL